MSNNQPTAMIEAGPPGLRPDRVGDDDTARHSTAERLSVERRRAHWLSKSIGRALTDYHMIDPGDRILVAVSGGKDSMTLLKLLEERRRITPFNYELVAFHVAADYQCGGIVEEDQLETFFAELGVEFRIVPLRIKQELDLDQPGASCFWCSRSRRRLFFEWADQLGCSKIAMGHHKDDIVETTLLNLFFHGEFSTMVPKQEFFEGQFHIIRPLCYVEEPIIASYAKVAGFPPQVCTCPIGRRSNRQRIKQMIRLLQQECPGVKNNLFKASRRVKPDYLLEAIDTE